MITGQSGLPAHAFDAIMVGPKFWSCACSTMMCVEAGNRPRTPFNRFGVINWQVQDSSLLPWTPPFVKWQFVNWQCMWAGLCGWPLLLLHNYMPAVWHSCWHVDGVITLHSTASSANQVWLSVAVTWSHDRSACADDMPLQFSATQCRHEQNNTVFFATIMYVLAWKVPLQVRDTQLKLMYQDEQQAYMWGPCWSLQQRVAFANERYHMCHAYQCWHVVLIWTFSQANQFDACFWFVNRLRFNGCCSLCVRHESSLLPYLQACRANYCYWLSRVSAYI